MCDLTKYGINIEANTQNFTLSLTDLVKRSSGLWLPFVPLVTLLKTESYLCGTISFLALPIFNFFNPEAILPIRTLHLTKELEAHSITDKELVQEIKALAQKIGIEKELNICESIGSIGSFGVYGNAIGNNDTGMFLHPSLIFPKLSLQYENAKGDPASPSEARSFFGIPDGPEANKIRSFLIAHEISHIKNNDCLNMDLIQAVTSISLCVLSCVVPESDIVIKGTAFILAPLVGSIFKMMYLRHRESEADASAARLLGDVEGGVAFFKNMQAQMLSTRNGPHASFMSKLYNKIAISSEGNNRLDLTHPSLSQRINQLKSLSKSMLVTES